VTPETWHDAPHNATSQSKEREYLRTLKMVHEYEALAARYELLLDTDPWGPNHPERQQWQEAARHRAFNKALENLEGLVVQRLFELEKMNSQGTGVFIRLQKAEHLS
jgi:hypothetical protein